MNISNSKRILDRSNVSGLPNVHILGNKAKRVTFHSQQRRAFNLIWALFSEGKLEKGKKLAIIGGGLAGMTAAVAAQSKGCQVTIFEQAQNLLPLWSGNSTRYVHPNIYDWPEETSKNELTRLPVLNWQAGFANEVASQIIDEWDEFSNGITVRTSCKADDISEVDGKPTINVTPYDLVDVDCIIVAVGFGIENLYNVPNAQTYWKNDALNQSAGVTSTDTKSYLITGCGDGGLIDALRLCLLNFDHKLYSEDFLNRPEFESLKNEILDAEKDIQDLSDADPTVAIIRKYNSFDIPKSLLDEFRKKVRTDTDITLNSSGHSPLTKYASIHNRVLIFLLMKLNKIKYVRAKATKYTMIANKHRITFEYDNGNIEDKDYDHLVIRHGPVSILTDLLGTKCTIPDLAGADATSNALWPEGFYDNFPVTTPNQNNYLKNNVASLYDRLESMDYDPMVKVIKRGKVPYYKISILRDAPANYLSDLKTHKGFPITIVRRSEEEITSQSGNMNSITDFNYPNLRVGAPISNNLNLGDPRNLYGSIGCFVITDKDKIGLISTSHVLQANNYINGYDIVLLYDKNYLRFNKSVIIAELIGTIPFTYLRDPEETFNTADAGLAILRTPLDLKATGKTIKAVSSDKVYLDQKVWKRGAGSGITWGKVSALSCTIKVAYQHGYAHFENIFEIKGQNNKRFSKKGDSGALVLNEQNEAIGLIFAGTTTSSYVCPIEPILSHFKCQILEIED